MTSNIAFPQELQNFVNLSKQRILERGEILTMLGDTPETFTVVLDGVIFFMGYPEDVTSNEDFIDHGRQVCYHHALPGMCFGETVLLYNDRPPEPINALSIADRESRIAQMARPALRRFAESHPHDYEALRYYATHNMVTRETFIARTLNEFVNLDVHERIKITLRRLALSSYSTPEPGGRIILIGREQLSAIIHCTREVVSRALHALEKKHVIELRGRRIFISDTSPIYDEEDV